MDEKGLKCNDLTHTHSRSTKKDDKRINSPGWDTHMKETGMLIGKF